VEIIPLRNGYPSREVPVNAVYILQDGETLYCYQKGDELPGPTPEQLKLAQQGSELAAKYAEKEQAVKQAEYVSFVETDPDAAAIKAKYAALVGK
jgi:hypothetical protein